MPHKRTRKRTPSLQIGPSRVVATATEIGTTTGPMAWSAAAAIGIAWRGAWVVVWDLRLELLAVAAAAEAVEASVTVAVQRSSTAASSSPS
ncbi:hypothetical protein WN943_019887 [Citrus x changshan-huyou]